MKKPPKLIDCGTTYGIVPSGKSYVASYIRKKDMDYFMSIKFNQYKDDIFNLDKHCYYLTHGNDIAYINQYNMGMWLGVILKAHDHYNRMVYEPCTWNAFGRIHHKKNSPNDLVAVYSHSSEHLFPAKAA